MHYFFYIISSRQHKISNVVWLLLLPTKTRSHTIIVLANDDRFSKSQNSSDTIAGTMESIDKSIYIQVVCWIQLARIGVVSAFTILMTAINRNDNVCLFGSRWLSSASLEYHIRYEQFEECCAMLAACQTTFTSRWNNNMCVSPVSVVFGCFCSHCPVFRSAEQEQHIAKEVKVVT